MLNKSSYATILTGGLGKSKWRKDMPKNVELQLKALRKKKKVTQKELAKALNVSFQTISKWENGV